MSVSVSMRTVIEGGGLKEPWIPRTIVHSGGIAFIEVSLMDRRLFQFVDIQNPTNRNAPFAQNHFFKELKALRNAASDIAIWEYMKSRDPLLSDQSDQDKLIKAYKKNIDESAMPAYVTVQLPEVEFNGGGVALKCEPIAVRCIFSASAISKVHVECTESVLTYIRCAALKAAEDDGTEKQKRGLSGVPGVRCDKRRRVVYVVVKSHNSSRRIYQKPVEWNDTCILHCARELRDKVVAKGEEIEDHEPDADLLHGLNCAEHAEGGGPEDQQGDGEDDNVDAAGDSDAQG